MEKWLQNKKNHSMNHYELDWHFKLMYLCNDK